MESFPNPVILSRHAGDQDSSIECSHGSPSSPATSYYSLGNRNETCSFLDDVDSWEPKSQELTIVIENPRKKQIAQKTANSEPQSATINPNRSALAPTARLKGLILKDLQESHQNQSGMMPNSFFTPKTNKDTSGLIQQHINNLGLRRYESDDVGLLSSIEKITPIFRNIRDADSSLGKDGKKNSKRMVLDGSSAKANRSVQSNPEVLSGFKKLANSADNGLLQKREKLQQLENLIEIPEIRSNTSTKNALDREIFPEISRRTSIEQNLVNLSKGDSKRANKVQRQDSAASTNKNNSVENFLTPNKGNSQNSFSENSSGMQAQPKLNESVETRNGELQPVLVSRQKEQQDEPDANKIFLIKSEPEDKSSNMEVYQSGFLQNQERSEVPLAKELEIVRREIERNMEVGITKANGPDIELNGNEQQVSLMNRNEKQKGEELTVENSSEGGGLYDSGVRIYYKDKENDGCFGLGEIKQEDFPDLSKPKLPIERIFTKDHWKGTHTEMHPELTVNSNQQSFNEELSLNGKESESSHEQIKLNEAKFEVKNRFSEEKLKSRFVPEVDIIVERTNETQNDKETSQYETPRMSPHSCDGTRLVHFPENEANNVSSEKNDSDFGNKNQLMPQLNGEVLEQAHDPQPQLDGVQLKNLAESVVSLKGSDALIAIRESIQKSLTSIQKSPNALEIEEQAFQNVLNKEVELATSFTIDSPADKDQSPESQITKKTEIPMTDSHPPEYLPERDCNVEDQKCDELNMNKSSERLISALDINPTNEEPENQDVQHNENINILEVLQSNAPDTLIQQSNQIEDSSSMNHKDSSPTEVSDKQFNEIEGQLQEVTAFGSYEMKADEISPVQLNGHSQIDEIPEDENKTENLPDEVQVLLEGDSGSKEEPEEQPIYLQHQPFSHDPQPSHKMKELEETDFRIVEETILENMNYTATPKADPVFETVDVSPKTEIKKETLKRQSMLEDSERSTSQKTEISNGIRVSQSVQSINSSEYLRNNEPVSTIERTEGYSHERTPIKMAGLELDTVSPRQPFQPEITSRRSVKSALDTHRGSKDSLSRSVDRMHEADVSLQASFCKFYDQKKKEVMYQTGSFEDRMMVDATLRRMQGKALETVIAEARPKISDQAKNNLYKRLADDGEQWSMKRKESRERSQKLLRQKSRSRSRESENESQIAKKSFDRSMQDTHRRNALEKEREKLKQEIQNFFVEKVKANASKQTKENVTKIVSRLYEDAQTKRLAKERNMLMKIAEEISTVILILLIIQFSLETRSQAYEMANKKAGFSSSRSKANETTTSNSKRGNFTNSANQMKGMISPNKGQIQTVITPKKDSWTRRADPRGQDIKSSLSKNSSRVERLDTSDLLHSSDRSHMKKSPSSKEMSSQSNIKSNYKRSPGRLINDDYDSRYHPHTATKMVLNSKSPKVSFFPGNAAQSNITHIAYSKSSSKLNSNRSDYKTSSQTPRKDSSISNTNRSLENLQGFKSFGVKDQLKTSSSQKFFYANQ